jgi:uncharacterized SAM-binding protein YcdF (DUF218 family)
MKHRIGKVAAILILAVLAFVILPSIPQVRAALGWPLVVSSDSASGDACYVLGAGNAIWERLAAASDLYHMRRVPKIILMRDDSRGPYSFTAHASRSATEWEVEYLAWRGVPRDRVQLIDHREGPFGTLSEARSVARVFNGNSLVIVTSAPHTRRSLLAFRRVLPKEIAVVPYSASSFKTSAELYNPLWVEYLKLVVYAIFLFH